MIMRIKELRVQSGVAQGVLADRMGVVQSAVSSWESEAALPKTRDIPRLAQALGCSIEDLFVPVEKADCSHLNYPTK